MPRRPEVFVRPVSMAEGQRLQRISRTCTARKVVAPGQEDKWAVEIMVE